MTAITRTAQDAGFRGGIDVRVSLRANAGDGNSAFDGAWFPRSRDLAVEVTRGGRALMTAIPRTALDAGFRGGIDVRVSLRDGAGDGNSAFDGAWFPRTRDLAVELPELIAELDRRGLRIERFTFALEAWAPAARKLAVGGRTVRTGGFRSMDPGVVCISWEGGVKRADLLVVPPETDVVTGARALRLCTRRGLPRSPQMVLAAARATPIPQVPELTPAG